MATPRNASVAKAFDILRAFSGSPGGLSLAEITERTGMSTATVHRFIVTLEEIGALSREGTGRYALGPMLAELGGRVSHGRMLSERMEPHLQHLVATFSETATLAQIVGRHVAVMRSVEPNRSLRIGMPVGRRLAPHCSAVGKVLLASLPEREKALLLGTPPYPALTGRTLTDPGSLETELEAVRRHGFALDNEEMEDGLCCVAVPLRNRDGMVAAALSVSGPSSRMDGSRVQAIRGELLSAAEHAFGGLRVESRTLPGHAAPRGPYPHIKKVGNFILLSGTSSRRPDGSFEGATIRSDGSVELDIAVQTAAVIRNIETMLSSVDLALEALVELDCYLVDMADYGKFNHAYRNAIGRASPARTTVGVRALPHPHQLIMVRSLAFHDG